MALSLSAINLPPPPVRDNLLASQFQFRPNQLKFPKIPSSSSSFNGISLKTVTADNNNNPFACRASTSQFGGTLLLSSYLFFLVYSIQYFNQTLIKISTLGFG